MLRIVEARLQSGREGDDVVNIDAGFRKLGWTDVTALKKRVLAVPDAEWAAHGLRQKRFRAHVDTQTVPLIFDSDYRHANATRQAAYEKFDDLLRPVFELLDGTYADGGNVIRCLFARLRPGGLIPPHVDTGFSLTHSHRVHVPIVTTDRVVFAVERQAVRMKEGELWEINNTRPHGVRNGGTEPRVHLIVDWAPTG